MKGETCLCRASSYVDGWRVINSRLRTSINLSNAFHPNATWDSLGFFGIYWDSRRYLFIFGSSQCFLGLLNGC